MWGTALRPHLGGRVAAATSWSHRLRACEPGTVNKSPIDLPHPWELCRYDAMDQTARAQIRRWRAVTLGPRLANRPSPILAPPFSEMVRPFCLLQQRAITEFKKGAGGTLGLNRAGDGAQLDPQIGRSDWPGNGCHPPTLCGAQQATSK